MIPSCFKENVGMVAGDGGFFNLQRILREPSDAGLFFPDVKVDRVILGEKNLKLGHRTTC
jgi:hypothetical protein